MKQTPSGSGRGKKPAAGGRNSGAPGRNSGAPGRGGQPSGKGAPRTGGPSSGGPRSGAPRSGGQRPGSSRTDGSKYNGDRYEGSKFGAPKSGAGKPGAGKSGAGKPGAGRGGPKAGAKFGKSTGKPDARGGKPQPRKSGTKPTKAFAGERFGRQLGAVDRKQRGPVSRPASTESSGEGVRLQKVLANAGVASRRVSEELIEEGRVEVNGEVVTELGVRVDPTRDAVHVDGMRVQTNEELKYYVFNKPRGVVSTMDDPEGRKCISDFVKNRDERLFHVGRLDVNTEGLLVLTNDGELANRLTHPSYEVPKKYLVQVNGPLPHGVGAEMKKGLRLEDGFANVDSFKLVDSAPGKVLIEVVLHSGRNRIVRRLFDAVGFPVKRLVRLEMGPLRLGDQKQGTVRALGPQEVGHLLASVGM
ncbi:pseudouridine synthase [Zhihengliuella sp.]|uniref:pseudouridine synthase n=1 Tax=Zhihengliuella sp. TaxID=1954483 RepID=UPI0028123360|nr:pseudouridine synthase [Zhihengliuella sp.]